MRIIGLTGSIACGKSTVSNYLSSLGYPVIDGDRLSREITVSGSPVLQSLYQQFGESIFYEDGSLNRRRLNRLVFSDPSALSALDRIMAPFLLSATKNHIEQLRSSGASLCFLDMPLLFEKGYDKLCDKVWTVWLPTSIQLKRLSERDGYSEEEALTRIRSVLSSDEKAKLADCIIDNSGTVSDTLAAVSRLLAEEIGNRQNIHRRQAPAPESGSVLPDLLRTHVPTDQRTPVPETMERPSSSLRIKKDRKASWRLPLWLKSSIIAFTVFLLIGTTAFFLMSGYLRSCLDRHIEEQNRIDNHYILLYRDLIEQYAKDYNLSPAFVSAVIKNESSFDARAMSGVGARGLMQLMPDTAEWIAGKLRVDGYAFERMYDPESNIRFGCWYLNYLSKLYLGDPVAVTAAYHAGQGQVKVWLSDPLISENGYSLPIESLPEGPTKNYAGKVLRDYGIYQEKYFSSDMLLSDPDHGG